MSNGPELTFFLGGDVMTGRGIDQILPHSCAPHLYEPYAHSALDYVELAEQVSGPIPRRVEYAYVWGDALALLDQEGVDARIINLETSVTTSEDAEPKGINYRMHPGNVPLLTAARIDCCVLANNHVLDWGQAGLLETLEALSWAAVHTAGAGRDLKAATTPAVLEVRDEGRVLVHAVGVTDSGIPARWRAGPATPGIHLLPDLSARSVEWLAELVERTKQPGDVAVASIHWGGNWGYEIPPEHRAFAHALIDHARIDVVHGHSSHHPKAIEVYRDRPILYGCGDLLNDYEGIGGHEEYRSELVLAYVVSVDARTGRLIRLRMLPLRIHRFRLEQPLPSDRQWLQATLDRECLRFGHHVTLRDDALTLDW
ncbi:MAG TPA: CapA family protein [Gemmatimonadaceae bacterium]|nr:CapA family protein [Gemmatimonadaceae bacterium]